MYGQTHVQPKNIRPADSRLLRHFDCAKVEMIASPSVRKLHLASLTAALVAFGGSPLAAQAQGTPAPTAKTATAKPASRELVNTLTVVGAVNACELAINAKVPLQTGVISAANSVTFAITNLHNSQIEGINATLKPEQLANGNLIEMIGRVKQGCYSKLNDTDKKYVDNVIAEVQAQLQKQGSGK